MKKILIPLALALLGCDAENDRTDSQLSVVTGEITNITSHTANGSGSIQTNQMILSRGICWAVAADPSLSDNHIDDASGQDAFTVPITGLMPETTYFVRSYATTATGIAYGENRSFLTLPEQAPCEDFTDIDGGHYPAIAIGTKCWMQKNLNVSRYRNGDVIPQVQDAVAWQNLTTGAWCYYANNGANGTVYGKLYNWYAVNDPRGLAPQGAHVASASDLFDLGTALGNVNLGGRMKSTSYWQAPNTGANNESGFTGLPGGYRWSDGTFASINLYGEWWTSTDNPAPFAQNYSLGFSYDFLSEDYRDKANGYAVRCVKD